MAYRFGLIGGSDKERLRHQLIALLRVASVSHLAHRNGRRAERARILAQAGATDAALDAIERLLAEPTPFTVHLLRLDPRWDPIRENARFKLLLTEYARSP